MNTTQNQNPEAAPDNNSGKSGHTIVCFSRNNTPKHLLSAATKFSSGDNAGLKWLEWVKEGDNVQRLRAAYDAKGMQGVREMLGLGKSQAYELIAKLCWRREKISREQKLRRFTYGRERRFKRLRHLFEYHGWTLGMNCCFLDSFIKAYPKGFKIGNKRISSSCAVCVASLPTIAVRNYMKRLGLAYYVTKVRVVPVADVPDARQTLIFACSKRHLTAVQPKGMYSVENQPIDEDMVVPEDEDVVSGTT